MPRDLYRLLKRERNLIERVDEDRFNIDMRNEDSEEMQQAARVNINKLAQCRKEIIVKMQEELKRRKLYEKGGKVYNGQLRGASALTSSKSSR